MKKLTGFKRNKWFGKSPVNLTTLSFLSLTLGQVLDSPTLAMNFETKVYEKEV